MALVGGSVELTASLPRSEAETNATVSHFTNIWKSGQAAAAANRLLTATDVDGQTDADGRADKSPVSRSRPGTTFDGFQCD